MSDPIPPPSKKGRRGPNHGGARPGAGRQTKELTKIKDDIRSAVNGQIDRRLPELVDALIGLGLGIFVEERTEDGSRFVYRQPPDRAAIVALLDRRLGRPPQTVEIDPSAIDIRTAVGLTRTAADEYIDPDEAADDDGPGPDA